MVPGPSGLGRERSEGESTWRAEKVETGELAHVTSAVPDKFYQTDLIANLSE